MNFGLKSMTILPISTCSLELGIINAITSSLMSD